MHRRLLQLIVMGGLLLVGLGAGSATAAPSPMAAAAAHRGGGPLIPDTAAGRGLRDWLDAFNRADLDALRAYHAVHSPPERVDDRALSDLGIHFYEGDFTVVQAEAAGAFRVVALVHTELSELWLRLEWAVSESPPHLVTEISIRPVSPPDDRATHEPLSTAALRQEVARYFAKLAAADIFSGTVLIAKDGVPLYAAAYGMAGKEQGSANQVDTKFNLGSMNKMFTAVAIAQLAQAGLLDLGAPISRYLPEYPRAVAEIVTVRHLLSHTSGLGDYFTPAFFAGVKDRVYSPRDYFPLFIDRPLQFEPGTRFRYSNAGYILLGAIIEAVSGQDYFTYVRDHVYLPAGMTDTGTFARDEDVPNRAIGYTHLLPDGEPIPNLPGPRISNTDGLPIRGGPAGGGYSTAHDLLAFDQALRGHRLLNPAFTELILAGSVDTIPGEGYGYGFQTALVGGTRVAGHAGGAPGISARLEMYLDRGLTVVILSNYDRGAAGTTSWLRNLLQRPEA